jgi:hypothetical protein
MNDLVLIRPNKPKTNRDPPHPPSSSAWKVRGSPLMPRHARTRA